MPTSNDLVERLHNARESWYGDLMTEAAAEIERLRAINADLLAALKAMVERYASEDQWEVALDCDVAARAAIARTEDRNENN